MPVVTLGGSACLGRLLPAADVNADMIRECFPEEQSEIFHRKDRVLRNRGGSDCTDGDDERGQDWMRHVYLLCCGVQITAGVRRQE